MKLKLLQIKLRSNDLKLRVTLSHHWGKVRMIVKIIDVEQGMARWKPEALQKLLLLF